MMTLYVGMVLCMGISPGLTREDLGRIDSILSHKPPQRVSFVDLAPTDGIRDLVALCKQRGYAVEYIDHHRGVSREQDQVGYPMIRELLVESDDICIIERRRVAPSCASLVLNGRRQPEAPTIVFFDTDFDGIACLLLLLGLEYPGLIDDANFMDTKTCPPRQLQPQSLAMVRGRNLVTPYYVDPVQNEKDQKGVVEAIIRMVQEGNELSLDSQRFIEAGEAKERAFNDRVTKMQREFVTPIPGVMVFDMRPYLSIDGWVPSALVHKRMVEKLGAKGLVTAIITHGHMGAQVNVRAVHRRINLRGVCPTSGKCFVAGIATIPLPDWPEFLQTMRNKKLQ